MIETDENQNPEAEQTAPTDYERLVPFGERLREIRLQHHLTQGKVERLTRRLSRRQKCPDFVLNKSRLSRIENGWSVPGPAKLLSLAKIYHLSVRDLVRLWSGQQAKARPENQSHRKVY